MRRAASSILAVLFLLVCNCMAMGQNATDETMGTPREFSARVLDDESGEPLAMVGVYVSNDNTTLTNFDGEFSIRAQATDVIRLTCVGRQTLYIEAQKLPQTVRMTILPGTLPEITVRAFDGTMLQISRQMEKGFNKRKQRRAQYFYRQTSVINQQQDIVEAFIQARSAANLRNLEFVSGRHGEATRDQWQNSIFSNMNLHHVLELGAMTRDVPFWDKLLTPLAASNQEYIYTQGKKSERVRGIAYYQHVYHIDIKEVNSNDQRLYRIELEPREGTGLVQPIMAGTLYVDRQTMQAQAFDGKLLNTALEFSRSQLESPLKVALALDLHIRYRYDHGFPEVAALSMQASFDNFQTRTMLFNVEGLNLSRKQSRNAAKAKENMIASISEAGYDSTFWAENEIIKRTEEERRIAEGRISRYQARIDSARAAHDALPPLERLADRLKQFGKAIPQEKVYLHMDNTCYFLGDTIWFAAYTRRTDNDQPSRISRVLYVELLNHDGFLVERKLVEMQGGRGNGYFALPDTLYSGFFELRAYTRWQLNWGQTVHPHIKVSENQFYSEEMANDYFRDYEKLYSRVFPVYDKPRQAGDFTRDMTLRPLRRQFKKEPAPPKLRLQLFPEGGDLVAGMPCRVAFEAALEDGEVREGCLSVWAKDEALRIKNERGEEVSSVRTENRGRGSFIFTPEEGKTYEAVFVADADSAVVRQKIKDILSEGVALRVNRKGDTWDFSIHSATGKPLGLTIMHEGVVSHFVQIENEEIRIKHDELPMGVNQVTVFDSIGHVWADRLFFVTRPYMAKPTLAISGQKEKYEPYEKVSLSIQSTTTGATDISLAVRDAKYQDNTFDTGDIMTEMLLSSEIKGFVPQPQWFFERDDEVHRRGLDLLMLTQGWRRFRWRDMAVKGEWELTHPNEHTQMVTGTVNSYYLENHTENGDKANSEGMAASQPNSTNSLDELNKNNPKFLKRRGVRKEVTVHAEFVRQTGGKGVVGETMTEDGQFKIDLPRFYGDCVFFLAAADTSEWDKKHPLQMKKFRQHEWIQMEDDEWERVHEDAEFYVRLNFAYPRWVKPYTYYQTHQAALRNRRLDNVLLTDGTHLLNEVTVRARRNRLRNLDFHKPVYVIDAYEAGNAVMDAGLMTTLHSGDVDGTGNFGLGKANDIAYAAITNYISDMNLHRAFDTKLYYDTIMFEAIYPNRAPAASYWKNDIISPLERRRYSRLEYIDKIYLYTDYSPRREGDERFESSNQPSVEVSLHRYPDWSRRVTYRDRRYILHGFAYQEDFYHPDYSKQRPTQPTDYRRTLYWNPELKLDDKGHATIHFWNNSRHTTLEVEAQGQASDGTLLYNNVNSTDSRQQ